MQFKSEFLREIVARGFLHQSTDPAELDALAARKVVTAYIGFDATGDSLHVGHLVGIMLPDMIWPEEKLKTYLASGYVRTEGKPVSVADVVDYSFLRAIR